MPETEAPPREERLSPRQVADLLGVSVKAVEQRLQRFRSAERAGERPGRGALRHWKDPESKRVFTTRAWLDEAGLSVPAELEVVTRSALESPPQLEATETTWQKIAQEQALEILRLRARIMEFGERTLINRAHHFAHHLPRRDSPASTEIA